MLKNKKKHKLTAKELQKIIQDKFKDEDLYDTFCNLIYEDDAHDIDEWISSLDIEEYE